MPTLAELATSLIIPIEGLDQPWKWPGGASGITIGRGYDLGYEENFAADWLGVIPAAWRDRLAGALGRRGLAAKRIAWRYKDIMITPAQADNVFARCSLPKYIAETLAAFPGLDALPTEVQAALVSLVYNRGASMEDNPQGAHAHNRLEMRQVRDAVAVGDMQAIVDALRAMKRLWVGGSDPGLVVRRETEAEMVASAIQTA